MSIATIIAEIAADLAVTYPSLVTRIGARFVDQQQDLPPRIVWVPLEDDFGPTDNISENPRQLLSCLTKFEVHVWGESDALGYFGPTEELKNALLASLYLVAHGYFDLGKGRWESEDGRISDLGGLYVLEVTFGIPITEQAQPTVVITSINQSSVMALPSGDLSNPLASFTPF